MPIATDGKPQPSKSPVHVCQLGRRAVERRDVSAVTDAHCEWPVPGVEDGIDRQPVCSDGDVEPVEVPVIDIHGFEIGGRAGHVEALRHPQSSCRVCGHVQDDRIPVRSNRS